MRKRIGGLGETMALILLVILLILFLFFDPQDLLSAITKNVTALSLLLAVVALFMNYKIYKSRIIFESLTKLHEIFHIELRDDRDRVVDVKITDKDKLNKHLKKIDDNDQNEEKIKRSILMVLNFYALIGMMTQNRYLPKRIAVEHFGGAICHKVEDWKAFIKNLSKNKNYKEMIGHVQYIFDQCQ